MGASLYLLQRNERKVCRQIIAAAFTQLGRVAVEHRQNPVHLKCTGFSTVNRSCAAALKESDGRRNSCPCSSWCPDC